MNSRFRTGASGAVFAALCLMLFSEASATMIPTSVSQATGKEFSNNIDINDLGGNQIGQALFFSGTGSVVDSRNYGGAQLDALSARNDPFFQGLFNGTSALLAGTQKDTTWEGTINYPVMSVTPDGAVRGWAKKTDFITTGINDVDCLDASGPDGVADADLYSLRDDGSDTSIWDYNGGAPIQWMSRTELNAAIGLPVGVNADLDALIVNGNDMIFSIRAILGYYDGGELFVYTRGAGANAAHFLTFGGQYWDTAFNSGGYLGCHGDVQEVDVLSAVGVVPEPATLATLAVGGLALLRRRNR